MIPALLAALLLLQTAPPEPDVPPGTQVFTAADLHRAGVARPADLLLLLDGWTAEAFDGWLVLARPPGAAPGTSAGWEVWLDGHRLTNWVFAYQDLNRLPIAVHDIVRVEATPHPTVVEGYWAPAGVVHIYTASTALPRAEPGGVQAQAAYWLGNEAGDPGPLRFLGDDTPNVDHLGPDRALSLGWTGRQLGLQATGVQRKDFVTDLALRDRTIPLTVDYPTRETGGVRLDGRWASTSRRHTLTAGYSEADDFVYLEAAGREVPVNSAYRVGSVAGAEQLGARTMLRYRAGTRTTTLRYRANRAGWDPDWRTTDVEGATSVVHRTARTRTQVGVQAARHVATTPAPLAPGSIGEASAFATVARETGLLSFALAGHLRRVQAATHLSGQLQFDVARRPHQLRVLLGVAERPAFEAYPFWFWTAAGYPFADALGIDYAAAQQLPAVRSAHADLHWATSFDGGQRAGVSLTARRYADLLLETIEELPADPAETSFTAATRVRFASVDRAALFGLTAHVAHAWSAFAHRFSVHVLPFASGPAAFRQVLQRRPQVTARSRWQVQPVASLRLGGTVAYRAGTRWLGYTDPTVASAWALDIMASKGAWNDRLRLDLIGRNLLNRRYRHHPLGATYDLSVIVRLALQLGARES